LGDGILSPERLDAPGNEQQLQDAARRVFDALLSQMDWIEFNAWRFNGQRKNANAMAILYGVNALIDKAQAARVPQGIG
jgi:hypothetical protein